MPQQTMRKYDPLATLATAIVAARNEMSKQNRQSTVLLICPTCGRKYQPIKNAMRTCGAVSKGVVCGGVLVPQEKQHRPPEKPHG
jgi:hypothetical protein